MLPTPDPFVVTTDETLPSEDELEQVTWSLISPEQLITGTVHAYDGLNWYDQTVELYIPEHTIELDMSDTWKHISEHALEVLHSAHNFIPWVMVCVAVIAIFTIIKREVRL